jgi:hypothetical protein
MSDANDPKKWNINYSWNQPYSYNTWQYYAANQNALEIELDRLDAIDLLVDNMLTFPDAEVILNKLRKQGDSNV